MFQKAKRIAPRPVTALELNAKHKRVSRDLAIVVGLSLLLIGSWALDLSSIINTDTGKRSYEVSVFWLIVLTAFFFISNLVGLLGTNSAGLDSQRLAWLQVASERLPEVATFLAEVRAQDRDLLSSEYDSLEAFYRDKVNNSLHRLV